MINITLTKGIHTKKDETTIKAVLTNTFDMYNCIENEIRRDHDDIDTIVAKRAAVLTALDIRDRVFDLVVDKTLTDAQEDVLINNKKAVSKIALNAIHNGYMPITNEDEDILDAALFDYLNREITLPRYSDFTIRFPRPANNV